MRYGICKSIRMSDSLVSRIRLEAWKQSVSTGKRVTYGRLVREALERAFPQGQANPISDELKAAFAARYVCEDE